MSTFSLLLLFVLGGDVALWGTSLQHSPCWLPWVTQQRSQFILRSVSVELLGTKVIVYVSLYPEKCLHCWLCWEGHSAHLRHCGTDKDSLDFGSEDEQELLPCPSVHLSLVVDALNLEVRSTAFLLLSKWGTATAPGSHPENAQPSGLGVLLKCHFLSFSWACCCKINKIKRGKTTLCERDYS